MPSALGFPVTILQGFVLVEEEEVAVQAVLMAQDLQVAAEVVWFISTIFLLHLVLTLLFPLQVVVQGVLQD